MKKMYTIHLPDSEQQMLVDLVNKGVRSAREINRARILLLSNEGMIDKEIVAVLGVAEATVQRIRERYCKDGLTGALKEHSRRGRPLLLDDKGEATLIALTCSDPPQGRTLWTMRLLADKMVELNVVDAICDETIRLHLKKINSNPGKNDTGKSPV